MTLAKQGIYTGGLPGSYKELSDETFGKKSYIFLHYPTLPERWNVERMLKKEGFEVSDTYCRIRGNCKEDTPHSQVRVSYFKGWHWDE